MQAGRAGNGKGVAVTVGSRRPRCGDCHARGAVSEGVAFEGELGKRVVVLQMVTERAACEAEKSENAFWTWAEGLGPRAYAHHAREADAIVTQIDRGEGGVI